MAVYEFMIKWCHMFVDNFLRQKIIPPQIFAPKAINHKTSRIWHGRWGRLEKRFDGLQVVQNAFFAMRCCLIIKLQC